MTCWYCTEHGESRDTVRGSIEQAELLRLIRCAYEAGFRTFRFTGGEPTLRRDLGEIMEATQRLGDDVRIAMTTNGTRIERVLPVIKQLIEPRIFLSIDGVHENPAIGLFRIEKILTDRIAAIVDEVAGAIPLRFNFVLTRGNLPQLWEIIDFASTRGVDVKIFELLLRNYFYAGDRERLAVFEEQYVPVRSIIPELQARYGPARSFPGLGGRGIPMSYVDTGAIKIAYFDSLNGSHYHDACRQCPLFPCQEGLYSAVLSSGGTIHPAGCENMSFHFPVVHQSDELILSRLATLRKVIEDGHFTAEIPAYLEKFKAGPEEAVPT